MQFSGAGVNLQNPFLGRAVAAAETFVRPSTVFVLDPETQPPSVQNWNVSVQRAFLGQYVAEVRYVGAKGRRLPRNVEANPAVFGPGATAQNADGRRLYANCPPAGSACELSTVAILNSVARSSYQAGQFSVSRRFGSALGFNVSCWYSQSFDHLSAMNLSGAAARPLASENDLVQNPFDLEEWGRRCSTRATDSSQAPAGSRRDGIEHPLPSARCCATGLYRLRLRQRRASGEPPADFGRDDQSTLPDP